MIGDTDDPTEHLKTRVAAVTADVEEIQSRADQKITHIRGVVDKAVEEARHLNELMEQLAALLEREDES